MIQRNGTTVSVLVEFDSGFPDAGIDWTLYDEDGLSIDTGTITPIAGDVSAFIVVPSASNTLGVGVLTGFRDLVWTYDVDGEVVNGDERYTIEARPPWGPTPAGVRNKLGVEAHELPDEEISLVRAYYDLLTIAGDPDLSAYTPSPRERLSLSDAVEALAGLTIIPTLQMRTPLKESSGTDTFQRHPADWELLAEGLRTILGDGILILDPTFDPFAGAGAIFLLATPATDPVTGA